VHGNNLTDTQLKAFVDRGVSFSVTPEVEMAYGHGHPSPDACAPWGPRHHMASISNRRSAATCSTWRAWRWPRTRARQCAGTRAQRRHPFDLDHTGREALDWITTRGAAMLGAGDRIGSLAPGKQADIIVMSLGRWSMWPVHDPVASAVMQGSGARVRDVLVAGTSASAITCCYGRTSMVCGDGCASGERILSRLNLASVSARIAAA